MFGFYDDSYDDNGMCIAKGVFFFVYIFFSFSLDVSIRY